MKNKAEILNRIAQLKDMYRFANEYNKPIIV